MKLAMYVLQSSICNCDTVSSRTLGVAVAVSAIIGTCGYFLLRIFSFLVLWSESWPHSDIQWLSSIANKFTFILSNRDNVLDKVSLSGAT